MFPRENVFLERQLSALPCCFHMPVTLWKSLADALCFVIEAQDTLHVARYCSYRMNVYLVNLVDYS